MRPCGDRAGASAPTADRLALLYALMTRIGGGSATVVGSAVAKDGADLGGRLHADEEAMTSVNYRHRKTRRGKATVTPDRGRAIVVIRACPRASVTTAARSPSTRRLLPNCCSRPLTP